MSAWDRAPLTAAAPAPDLAVKLYTRHLSFGEPGESPFSKWWTKRKLHEQLKDVKAEFPFLAHARWEPAEDAEEAPYRLVIEATHAIEGNKTLHWFSATSRYLIPSSETGVIDLHGRVYRGETLLKAYDAVGRYRNKRHLVFLALPWLWGYRVPSRTMEDTFRDLFLQVQRDAATLFSTRGAPP